MALLTLQPVTQLLQFYFFLYTVWLYVYLIVLIDFNPVVDDDKCFKYEVHIWMLMAKWCSVEQSSHATVNFVIHNGDYNKFMCVFIKVIQLAGKLLLGCNNWGKKLNNKTIQQGKYFFF